MEVFRNPTEVIIWINHSIHIKTQVVITYLRSFIERGHSRHDMVKDTKWCFIIIGMRGKRYIIQVYDMCWHPTTIFFTFIRLNWINHFQAISVEFPQHCIFKCTGTQEFQATNRPMIDIEDFFSQLWIYDITSCFLFWRTNMLMDMQYAGII